MPKLSPYTVGGTVQAGGGLYITRQADKDLLKLNRAGTFAYVLASRQVGKSSLMVRTAETLITEGIRPVMIDLSGLGSKLTEEAWYLGLLTEIGDKLNLEFDAVGWWRNRKQLGASQRLTQFFREVVLTKIVEPVVIFVDEIDSTLGLPFTDDFYAAIRFLYNSRATVPEFRRLSFVLIGVATPSDLISDAKRTPFNIGQRVDITDFSYHEALPLAEGLELPLEEAKQVLRWVMKWTSGHPYLTQLICRSIAEQYRRNWTETDVDRMVADTLFGKMSEHDNNLLFVSDMLTKRAPDKLGVLSMYRDVRLARHPVRDEELSPIKAHLKLSGVVTRVEGKLVVRNSLYEEVFDKRWIQEHWPVGWWQTVPLYARIGSAAILFLSIVSFILTIHAFNLAAQNHRIAEENKRIALSARQALKEQTRLKLRADSASNQATASAQRALEEATKSKAAEARERLARMEEEIQHQRADEQAKLARLREAQADSNRRIAVRNLSEVERRRRIDIAQKLIREAIAQQHLGNSELGILLARQAFLFNQANRGSLEGQIYDALLKTLNGEGGPILLRGHTAAVKSVVFNPTGDILASAGDDKSIILWLRQRHYTNPTPLHGHDLSVRALAFSADGKTLASGSDDSTIRLWNMLRPNSAAMKILPGHQGGVWAVAFSPNGQSLVSAGADSTVRIWNLNRPDSGAAITYKCKARVRDAIFSADGEWLGAAGEDGAIQLLRVSGQNLIKQMEVKHEGGIKSLALESKLGLLASGGADGNIRLWNWRADENRPRLRKEFLAHEAAINALSFSTDGKRLATASSDKRVKIWEIGQTTEPALVLEIDSHVWSTAFSPDGNVLVTGSTSEVLKIWTTQVDTLAEKACSVLKRNLSEEEWHRFVGTDIAYEETCTGLSGGNKLSTNGEKDEDK